MSRIDMMRPRTTTPATLRTAPSIFSGYSGASTDMGGLRARTQGFACEDRTECLGEVLRFGGAETVDELAHGPSLLLELLVGDLEARGRERHQLDPTVVGVLLSLDDAELDQLVDVASGGRDRETEL